MLEWFFSQRTSKSGKKCEEEEECRQQAMYMRPSEKFRYNNFTFFVPRSRHQWRCWVSQCFFLLLFDVEFISHLAVCILLVHCFARYLQAWGTCYWNRNVKMTFWLLLLWTICRSLKLCSVRTFFNRFCWCCEHIWRLQLQSFVIFHPSTRLRKLKLKYWSEIAKRTVKHTCDGNCNHFLK